MGLFATIIASASLCLAACGPVETGLPVTKDGITCSLDGEALAGASPEEVCAAFRQAALDSGRSGIGSIELTAVTSTEASARVLDSDNRVLAKLDFSITDRTLSAMAWRDFANAMARELAKDKPSE